NIDAQLKGLAGEIIGHLQKEVAAARTEMEEDEIQNAFQSVTLKGNTSITEKNGQPVCKPVEACKVNVFAEGISSRIPTYPYFGIIAGTDGSGVQQIKWT